jgi:hypothetical protein
MEVIKSEIFDLLKILLPGFLTAAIFYGVTSFPKRSEFEAVVTALIFTTIIQGILVPLKGTLFWIGKSWSLGGWSSDIELVWLIVLATILGLLFSFLINNDYLFAFLRFFKITTQTSHPSEWYSIFSKSDRYVVLHLKGERRLHGWPFEWPNDPKKGHFVIENPMWIAEDEEGKNIYIPLPSDRYMVLAVDNVEFVEILQYGREWEMPNGN